MIFYQYEFAPSFFFSISAVDVGWPKETSRELRPAAAGQSKREKELENGTLKLYR